MSDPLAPLATQEPSGFLSPTPGGHPQSHCVRCGKPTPPGIAMCEADNPGGIKGPSATQVHGTILVGVIIGAIVFLLLGRLAVGSGGPYEATIVGRASGSDGAAEVAITVVNRGASAGTATCRVTRDGAPRPDDLTFRTERIAPGDTVQLTRDLPIPDAGSAPYDLPRMSVICT